MALDEARLVGYLRAQYARSSKYRVALFALQFAVAIPAAVSVIVTDEAWLYVLAIIGTALLVLWWVVNTRYQAHRRGAETARRGALVLGGTSDSFSPSEVQELRSRFTVNDDEAAEAESDDYYATREPPGARRLGEMLEESAFFSEHLQQQSSRVLQWTVVAFAALFAVLALVSGTALVGSTQMAAVRIFLSVLVFVLSSDVVGSYLAHTSAARELGRIRSRLIAAERSGYPPADLWLAMTDYNAAVESAPESVPYLFKLNEGGLNKRWAEYKADRDEARKSR